MERFPVLSSHLGALEALHIVVKHEATGAVVETEGRHELVAWRDIAAAAARGDNTPLARVRGLQLRRLAVAQTVPPSTVVGIQVSGIPGYEAARAKFSTFGAIACPKLSPPPYPCVSGCGGDLGKCPY
jgi:hypothetical protein